MISIIKGLANPVILSKKYSQDREHLFALLQTANLQAIVFREAKL